MARSVAAATDVLYSHAKVTQRLGQERHHDRQEQQDGDASE